MNPALPPQLADALERLAEGRSGRELAARAQTISSLYRSGAPSSQAIQGVEDALAYALTRMPGTYAAVSAALCALAERSPDFNPRTVADIGCGPGTASWAALELFEVETLVLVDGHRALLDLAKVLLKAATALVDMRQADLSTAVIPPSDLVVAAYVLTELTQSAALALAERLWAASAGALVIVEPGTPSGWARLMEVRAKLIQTGAAVVAPCPHARPCPVQAPDWCHFAQRLPRSRAHRLLKSADAPFEDEKYAYLALLRPGPPQRPPGPRILAPPIEDKAALSFKLCAPSGQLEFRRIARRDKAASRRVRRLGWGDVVET